MCIFTRGWSSAQGTDKILLISLIITLNILYDYWYIARNLYGQTTGIYSRVDYIEDKMEKSQQILNLEDEASVDIQSLVTSQSREKVPTFRTIQNSENISQKVYKRARCSL